MPVQASVVICTRNRAGYLARTLATLAQQQDADFEVVVADDGSDDDTRARVEPFRDRLPLRYIRRAHAGRAAARNAAIRAAQGELLISSDDDRLCHPRFVADHIAAHADRVPRVVVGQQRGVLASWDRGWNLSAAELAALLVRRPDIAASLVHDRAELISVEALDADLAGVIAAHELDEPWFERHVRPIVASFGPDLRGFAFPWTVGVTGNLSVPRALAESVGLLDEGFVGWGLEDTDLHFRLTQAGAATRVLDGALSWHQLHDRPREQASEWGRNAMRLLEKYDSVEVCLYLRVIRRRLTFLEANQIALTHTPGPLASEFVRVTKELFRMLSVA